VSSSGESSIDLALAGGLKSNDLEPNAARRGFRFLDIILQSRWYSWVDKQGDLASGGQ
jgi:hypothetical protein